MNKNHFFQNFCRRKRFFFLNQKAVPNFKSENFKQCLEEKRAENA
jgi:hypothetical protein